MEKRIDGLAAGVDKQSVYLIDNEKGEGGEGKKQDLAVSKDDSEEAVSAKEDWHLMKNQIFLGLLGSTTTPRTNIAPFISKCESAGVRFVYFSPRNMRRSKSIAIKMGIDVSFNCAISLRELQGEQKIDKYRMTSNYADWDVNAQMPHGIKEIETHLVHVDNVPLLVSLFTDATHETTSQMINILKDYGDSVLSVGSSHRFRNEKIFRSSDLSIGVDLLLEEFDEVERKAKKKEEEGHFVCGEELSREDIKFASALISHDCIFNFPSASSVRFLPDVISEGR